MLSEVLKKLQAMPVKPVEEVDIESFGIEHHEAASPAGATEWVTWTGTYYPTLDSVPWQARGSAIEVPATR